MNSGRYGGHPTSEGTASYVLAAKPINAAKLRIGAHGSTRFEYDDGFPVEILIDFRDGSYPHFELAHETHRYAGGGEPNRYKVRLTATQPRFGGVRWWFICPLSGRRVTKLFLPNGGDRFASRQAYRLGYACQRETKIDRVHRQGRKLHRALGGDGEWMDGPPDKPKWMRWRTYRRKMQQWETLEARLDAAWLPGAMQLLARFGR
ncbi:MAG: hypothetical protein AB7P50_11190 [Alphaproteobacteria bacterium]